MWLMTTAGHEKARLLLSSRKEGKSLSGKWIMEVRLPICPKVFGPLGKNDTSAGPRPASVLRPRQARIPSGSTVPRNFPLDFLGSLYCCMSKEV